MTTFFKCRTILLSGMLVGALSIRVQAGLLTNGGFEAGLAGWTRADQVGSEGSFQVQTGTQSPLTMTAVPPPPGGTRAAMMDAAGPGSHVLYQDFIVPLTVPGGVVRFSLFVNNGAPDFFTPPHLDFASTDPDPDVRINQQARVDIMTTTADPFSVAPGDVLQTVFQTQAGGPLVSGYNTFLIDITPLLLAHPGQTLRLRFAEVDNVFNFNLGVDNVDVNVVPEPATWIITVAPLFGLYLGRRYWLGTTRAH